MALGPVITALFSRIFLRFTLPWSTWLAIVVAGLGVAVMFGGRAAMASRRPACWSPVAYRWLAQRTGRCCSGCASRGGRHAAGRADRCHRIGAIHLAPGRPLQASGTTGLAGPARDRATGASLPARRAPEPPLAAAEISRSPCWKWFSAWPGRGGGRASNRRSTSCWAAAWSCWRWSKGIGRFAAWPGRL